MNMSKAGRGGRFKSSFRGLALFAVMIAVIGLPGASARFWTDPNTGFAVGGYDTVAYFVESAARPGASEFEVSWNGQAWRFANEGNRAVFIDNPEVYAPQFDGYGLVSVSRGLPAVGNPEIWEIYDNKLYFFHSRALRELWRKDSKSILSEANRRWPEVEEKTRY